MQALLRAPYINERTGGGRSRIRRCLVSANPSEPALLHRWTSLKVKTFPHQGFVKENGCIFLEAIIFIFLSVLESNPRKPSAPGLTGLSACCCRAGMGLGSSAGSGLPAAAALQPSVHAGLQETSVPLEEQEQSKTKSREPAGMWRLSGAQRISGGHSDVFPSHPVSTSTLASAAAAVVVPTTKEHSSGCGPWSHVPRYLSCNSD